MTKKGFLIVASFLFLWTVLTVVAVTWQTRLDWPDNVHIDYGFPLVWSTQTLSTIAGPANLWTVNVSALMIDLILWLGIMLITTSIMLYFFNKKSAN